jgi:hypothetical protein
MLFSDLYKYANDLPDDVISVKKLAVHIEAHHPDIGEVNFWPVVLDAQISLGHMVYERARSSAYGAAFTVANVRYDKNQNRCWRRFICCKELMHVFDDANERVDSREKFLQLMKELESRPLKDDISAMFSSEMNAEWMALLVLCPKRLRDKWRPTWADKTLSDYDVALKLKVPEAYVFALMDDYYDAALKTLTG